MASAQVFQSGFEDWTGTVPDDWAGSRTNLASSGVSQVTDDVHGGTYAVRLENATSSHKRFTTQPVAVTSGQNYSVSFWVRGAGETGSACSMAAPAAARAMPPTPRTIPPAPPGSKYR